MTEKQDDDGKRWYDKGNDGEYSVPDDNSASSDDDDTDVDEAEMGGGLTVSHNEVSTHGINVYTSGLPYKRKRLGGKWLPGGKHSFCF